MIDVFLYHTELGSLFICFIYQLHGTLSLAAQRVSPEPRKALVGMCVWSESCFLVLGVQDLSQIPVEHNALAILYAAALI